MRQNLEKMIQNNIDDAPKYMKRRASNKSDAREKSKHRHIYTDCLLVEDGHPHKATYCKLCGKIQDVKMFETKKSPESSCSVVMKDDEIFDKYKELEKFQVKTIFAKYISLIK